MREELELVLDVVRREQRAAAHLADVLGAIDDLELPAVVDQARISGVKKSFRVDRFHGRVGPLVVFLEQHRTAHQDLAAFGNLDFDARRRLADGVELDPAIGLKADVGAGLGRAVELLQVDPDRTIKAEQIGADGSARRISNPDAAHAENVAQRCINQQIPKCVQQSIARRYSLAVEDCRAAAPGDVGEVSKQSALDRARVLHADHDLGEQVFEHSRRRKVVGRPDLAQVRHHRVA